ncbi:MAG: hypothetical protein WCG27_00880 [Pseudomonadota bacterium]
MVAKNSLALTFGLCLAVSSAMAQMVEDLPAPMANFWWETPVVYRPSSSGVNFRAFEFEAQGDYFITSGYYDRDRALKPMAQTDSFERRQGEITLRYGMARQLEIRGGGRYRQNNSIAGDYQTSSAGLESYFGGVKYTLAPVNRWQYGMDAQWRQTAYRNTEYPVGTLPMVPRDEIVMGDAGTEITAGLHISWRGSERQYFSGSLTYNKAPGYLSPEVLYNMEAAFLRLTRQFSWAFYFGIRGIYSLKMDEYAAEPDRKPLIATGATALYNSYHREMVTPYVGFNIGFEGWRFGVQAARVITGRSTDEGMTFMGLLAWNSAGKTYADDKIDNFKEYSVEASVVKISPRSKFLRIDQGIKHGVDKGMPMDIYQTDYYGTNVLVGSGYVYDVGADWAIVRLTKKFRDTPVAPGFIARGR